MTKRRADMTPEERERACAQRRAAYQRKREQELAYAVAYRDANREKLRERDRNPSEKRQAYLKAYCEKNKERISARTKNWKSTNAARTKQNNAAWRRNNKERHCLIQHARRARVARVGGRLSVDIVDRLMALQQGLCACCGSPLNGSFHIDHVVPISKGGTNTDDNVQLLLPACNLKKGAMTHDEYMRRRAA